MEKKKNGIEIAEKAYYQLPKANERGRGINRL
jgi:hypothetical protein